MHRRILATALAMAFPVYSMAAPVLTPATVSFDDVQQAQRVVRMAIGGSLPKADAQARAAKAVAILSAVDREHRAPSISWHLGYLYLEGLGVDKDYQKGFELMRRAADGHISSVATWVAKTLLSRASIAPNDDQKRELVFQALHYLRDAAGRGYAPAKDLLNQTDTWPVSLDGFPTGPLDMAILKPATSYRVVRGRNLPAIPQSPVRVSVQGSVLPQAMKKVRLAAQNAEAVGCLETVKLEPEESPNRHHPISAKAMRVAMNVVYPKASKPEIAVPNKVQGTVEAQAPHKLAVTATKTTAPTKAVVAAVKAVVTPKAIEAATRSATAKPHAVALGGLAPVGQSVSGTMPLVATTVKDEGDHLASPEPAMVGKSAVLELQSSLANANRTIERLRKKVDSLRARMVQSAMDAQRLNEEALLATRRGDYETAVLKFRKSIAMGNVPAMANLGMMYVNGTGVARDMQQAVALMERSVKHGNYKAAENIAYMYLLGIGVPQDREVALKWYQKADAMGSVKAMKIVAQMVAMAP